MSNQIEVIAPVIRTIRGQKVILDADLARIYGVPTRVLNQAVKGQVTGNGKRSSDSKW